MSEPADSGQTRISVVDGILVLLVYFHNAEMLSCFTSRYLRVDVAKGSVRGNGAARVESWSFPRYLLFCGAGACGARLTEARITGIAWCRTNNATISYLIRPPMHQIQIQCCVPLTLTPLREGTARIPQSGRIRLQVLGSAGRQHTAFIFWPT